MQKYAVKIYEADIEQYRALRSLQKISMNPYGISSVILYHWQHTHATP